MYYDTTEKRLQEIARLRPSLRSEDILRQNAADRAEVEQELTRQDQACRHLRRSIQDHIEYKAILQKETETLQQLRETLVCGPPVENEMVLGLQCVFESSFRTLCTLMDRLKLTYIMQRRHASTNFDAYWMSLWDSPSQSLVLDSAIKVAVRLVIAEARVVQQRMCDRLVSEFERFLSLKRLQRLQSEQMRLEILAELREERKAERLHMAKTREKQRQRAERRQQLKTTTAGSCSGDEKAKEMERTIDDAVNGDGGLQAHEARDEERSKDNEEQISHGRADGDSDSDSEDGNSVFERAVEQQLESQSTSVVTASRELTPAGISTGKGKTYNRATGAAANTPIASKGDILVPSTPILPLPAPLSLHSKHDKNDATPTVVIVGSAGPVSGEKGTITKTLAPKKSEKKEGPQKKKDVALTTPEFLGNTVHQRSQNATLRVPAPSLASEVRTGDDESSQSKTKKNSKNNIFESESGKIDEPEVSCGAKEATPILGNVLVPKPQATKSSITTQGPGLAAHLWGTLAAQNMKDRISTGQSNVDATSVLSAPSPAAAASPTQIVSTIPSVSDTEQSSLPPLRFRCATFATNRPRTAAEGIEILVRAGHIAPGQLDASLISRLPLVSQIEVLSRFADACERQVVRYPRYGLEIDDEEAKDKRDKRFF